MNSPSANYLVSLLAARQAYIAARVAAGDVFYVSYWGRITRPPKTGYTTGVPTASIRKGSNLGEQVASAGTSNGQPWWWQQTGPGFVGGYGSKNGTAHFSAAAGKLATLGAFNQTLNAIALGARDANTLNNLPSEILYRGYIENLTATGRPFEQVRAADFRKYTDEVLTPGGRYFGDAWTEPTSRVP
ncbi:MAG: hypothetical protein ACTIA6_11005 [Pseudoclavibacter sp.]